MKITEITEGWGEYSNKSNHQMNKFKRNEEVDENWATGAMDAAGRSLSRGLTSLAGKMGSGQAQGASQLNKAVMGVMKNYQRYLGQAGLDQNYSSLQNYLKALGIKNPVMEAVPSQAQLAQAADNKDASKKLTRNQVMLILQKNIQQGLKDGSLPKELKKFLGQ